MKVKKFIIAALMTTTVVAATAQSDKGTGRSFDTPIITDSTSTMLIPYHYDVGLLTSNKALTWGNYFANIIVYDFKDDAYKKLFAQDCYIAAPQSSYYYNVHGSDAPPRYPYMTAHWVFYLVRDGDHNKNGKIDDKDPQILFVTDHKGTGLRSLTSPKESVIGMSLFEAQGFALLRIQRDENNDGDFKPEDKYHYLVRLNLSDLRLGKPIEFAGAP